MFRHEEFYTFDQVAAMVNKKFEYFLYGPAFRRPDENENRLRRSCWVDWNTALVFQGLDEAFIFWPETRPISIDASLLCRENCIDVLDDFKAQKLDEVIELHTRILTGFPLVDFNLGVLQIPDELTDRAASALRTYDGYTIGMPVDEVVASLILFQEWIDAAEGEPSPRPKGGRPPLALKAARAYVAKYPQGHEAAGKKWGDVEQELNVVSQTIKAGLMMLQK